MRDHIKALIFLLTLFAVGAFAQDGRPSDTPKPDAKPVQDVRAGALSMLGLSPEQVQQIRQLNVERKPLMDAAQKRFREANRALDAAIYADQPNDEDVQLRLRDVQAAQSEVARLRFLNEFAVRKVLTPEQLVRFREIRARFEQERIRIENERKMNRRSGDATDRPVPGFRQPIRQMLRQNKQKQAF